MAERPQELSDEAATEAVADVEGLSAEKDAALREFSLQQVSIIWHHSITTVYLEQELLP